MRSGLEEFQTRKILQKFVRLFKIETPISILNNLTEYLKTFSRFRDIEAPPVRNGLEEFQSRKISEKFVDFCKIGTPISVLQNLTKSEQFFSDFATLRCLQCEAG